MNKITLEIINDFNRFSDFLLTYDMYYENFLKVKNFWCKGTTTDAIILLGHKKNRGFIRDSKIIWLSGNDNNHSFYIYEKDDRDTWYILKISESVPVFPMENKLYHLIHGPKAISIPEAFRILSL